MIARKLKPCKTCGDPKYLFSNGNCKECYNWLQVASKRSMEAIQKTLITEAKPFRVTYQTTTIKKVSTRMQKLNAAYKVLRDQFMKKHPSCQARLEGCTGIATECHHSRGRGEYLLDDSTFKALCGHCHRYLETHVEVSRVLGFTKNRLNK